MSTDLPYPVHPAADLFPLMQGDDFERLVEDVRANGQMEPVVFDVEGRLIDGRNRARACARLGVEVQSRVYEGDDVVQFVVSHNLHRRHLTDSQRAMIAAELAALPHGGDRKSEAIKTPDGGLILTAPTRAEVKDLMQVSEGSLQRAKVITREGTPGLRALAKETNTPLEPLKRVAEQLPPEEQDAYVAQVRAGANPTKTAPRPASPSYREQQDTKWARVAEMADRGHSSPQIARAIGMSETGLKKGAADRGIEIRADRILGNARRLDVRRVIETTVDQLDSIAGTFPALISPDAIRAAGIDRDEAQEWVDSLSASITALSKAVRKIKESLQ